MVAIQTVRESNARIGELPEGLVALFLGATAGVGQSALKQFVERAVRPRIYIAARSASASAAFVEQLRQTNPEGTYTVIEKDVSLVRDTDEVVKLVRSKESRLDLLYMSMGFISFEGRQETREGLDGSMATRYYSRVRALQGVLPLLKAAAHPRVVAILAGGQEAKLNEEDLDLRRPGNYSIPAAAVHSATMLTLVLQRLATENPEISFVHAFPGFVATSNLTRGSSGIVGFLMRWILVPVATTLFAIKAEDAGARALFYATSDRYAVQGGSVSLAGGLERARATGGVFLANDKSESVGDERLLGDFKTRKVDEKVWNHTQDIFDAIVAA
ncbi:NAD(P)-binding protein [Thozetella sp. PMI_491]|nr:NAD(P)-binding protein [Thozetella sp. PMI_491]